MRYIFLILAITLSNVSMADPKWCQGKINKVWVKQQGEVLIYPTYRGGHTQICNVNIDWKGVPPETCKLWFSEAQVAYASKNNVVVYYDELASCSTIPQYENSPSPSYIMLE